MSPRPTINGAEVDATCRCAHHRAWPLPGRAAIKRAMRRRERHEARTETRSGE